MPLWNLISRRDGPVPWTCEWHGEIGEKECAECRREHTEYLETGTWTPG